MSVPTEPDGVDFACLWPDRPAAELSVVLGPGGMAAIADATLASERRIADLTAALSETRTDLDDTRRRLYDAWEDRDRARRIAVHLEQELAVTTAECEAEIARLRAWGQAGWDAAETGKVEP